MILPSLRNLTEEVFRKVSLRVINEVPCGALFFDYAAVKKHHPVGDVAREADLVSYQQHGTPFGGKFLDDVEHFVDKFWIKR